MASRDVLARYPLLRSPALWAIVVLEALVFVPVGAYLLWRFPAWSVMYLWEPGSLPIPDMALSFFYPVAAVGTFIGARRLIIAQRLWPAVGVLGASVLLMLIVAYVGRVNLMVVGTTAAFRDGPDNMLSVYDSALFYLVGAATVAVGISWGMTIWRLVLLARSAAGGIEAEAVNEARASTTRKSKTRKKTS